MTSTADQAISALRDGHDTLTALLSDLPEDGLTEPSGASEWTVADVLSHLGSGAEIGLAGLEASLTGAAAPDGDFNQSVWDRWNAMPPAEQADGFVKANDALVQRYEALDPAEREQQRIKISFLPEPVDVATSAGFRLNEFTLHSWDVRVAFDPAATLPPDAIPHLLAIAPYLFGWLGRPRDVLGGRSVAVAVRLVGPDQAFGLQIADTATITDDPANPAATLTLPAESWLRLISGRLAAAHTPAAVQISGELTLDQLRAIFPGY